MDVARRLRAGWSVTGGLSVAPNGYVLDLTVRNVADVSESEGFTILASNPVELGRQAATRVATILAAGPGGAARYSGIETSSADAYRHFTRGMMAASSEKLAEAAGQLDSAIAEDSGFVEAIRARQGVAVGLGDANGMHRMAVLAARHEDRLPELERLADEIRNVDSLGESTRADALSGELVARFPHDPRAYSARADLLTAHGRWADAEAVLSRELALDSLAMVAGDGPCTPCEVLWRLSQVRPREERSRRRRSVGSPLGRAAAGFAGRVAQSVGDARGRRQVGGSGRGGVPRRRAVEKRSRRGGLRANDALGSALRHRGLAAARVAAHE